MKLQRPDSPGEWCQDVSGKLIWVYLRGNGGEAECWFRPILPGGQMGESHPLSTLHKHELGGWVKSLRYEKQNEQPDSGPGRTVTVRAAVAVDVKGNWSVQGYRGWTDADAILESEGNCNDIVFKAFITADIFIPDIPVIAAKVEAVKDA